MCQVRYRQNFKKKYIIINDETKCVNVFTCNDIETRAYTRIKDKNFNIYCMNIIYTYIYYVTRDYMLQYFQASETDKILGFFTE